MSIELTINDIIEKVRNKDYETELEYPKYKKYKENHIFDEDKSVKWNREKVKKENEFQKIKMDEYNKDSIRLQNQFETDVKNAIKSYLNVDSDIIARELYSVAWEKGHSNGYIEVLNILYDLLDTQERILNEYKKILISDKLNK